MSTFESYHDVLSESGHRGHVISSGWIVVAAIALSVLVLLRAVPERKQVFAQPLSYNVATLYNVATFTVMRLILPAAVMLIGLAGLSSGVWKDSAAVVAIAMAIIAML